MPNPTSIVVLDGNSAPQTISTLDFIASLIGEIQASPTSNTLLDRLKTISTSLAAAIPAGTNIIGATYDAGPSQTTVWGVGNVPVSSSDMSGADADLTAAPTSGQKWVITDVIVSVDTNMRVDIKEETSGTLMFSGYFSANTISQITVRGKRKLGTANKKVVGRTSASGNVRILVGGYSEA